MADASHTTTRSSSRTGMQSSSVKVADDVDIEERLRERPIMRAFHLSQIRTSLTTSLNAAGKRRPGGATTSAKTKKQIGTLFWKLFSSS